MQFLRMVRATSNLAVAFPLLAAIGLVVALREKLVDWWFRRQNSRKVFIVCSRRNDWHDFLVNNLFPVLPASMSAVWLDAGSGSVAARAFPKSFRRALKDCKRPALVAITRGGLRVVPLERELSEWKTYARRDSSVQSHIRQILDAARADIATS